MKGLAWVWPSGAERWRNPVIVAVSVAAHVLVLSLLGVGALGSQGPVRISEPPPIYVEIEPRPLMQGEVARVQANEASEQNQTRPLPGSTSVSPPIDDPLDEDENTPTSQPTGRAQASGAPVPPAEVGTAPWQVRPRTLGDRIGSGLRTRGPGCASPQLLSAAERAICDDRFGERAAAAAPIDDTTNSRFAREGARALAEYEARRRPLAGGSGNVGPQDGVGSNFGIGVAGAHLDQSLRPDSTENVRTRRDGPRSSGVPLTPGGGFRRERQ